ncbi:MAG TPA: hypothetical protein VHW92_08425 [Mycobacteriales bacterium]|jgi:hypothetical protein|nr:hypothetical protein [Mycobacteriales bacterium]
MIPRPVRHALLVGSASLLCVATALVGSASARPASVTKGSPQPELKPFTLAAKDFNGGGSVAILPSGTLLAAYDVPTADHRGATKVCILPRSGRACATASPTIVPPSGASNTTNGVPQVVVVSAKLVELLVYDSTTGDELYTSTNGGSVFGSPVHVGSLDVDEAALVGSDIVFSPNNGLDGAEAQSVSVDAPASSSPAITSSAEAESIGDGSYKGGALVVDGSFDDGVIVGYAAAGKNFNSSSSYTKVGTFKNEDFLGISGDALLTQSTTGATPVRLRVFNGTSFGAAHTVPHGSGAGPENYVVDRDPRGEIHVFTVLAANSYNLEEQSTSTGAHWTSQQVLSNAVNSDSFNGGLDATGSGIILGTNADGGKATAYPVLARQSVTFKLSKSSVKKGKKITARGKARPAKKGRKVTLEKLEHGLWHSVAKTKESKTGAFKFRIKASKVGHIKYRAVAADTAGFLQFGYSVGRSLKVKK